VIIHDNNGAFPPHQSNYFINGLDYYHLLVESARERFWPRSLTNLLAKPDCRLKLILAVICRLFKFIFIYLFISIPHSVQ